MSLLAELAATIRAAGPAARGFPFERWAWRVFEYQYERNPAYRRLCERRGISPRTVARWQDIPAVPAAAFRQADLACGPAEAVFRSSGTTAGDGMRSRHAVPSLDLYRASAVPTFAHFLLPDAVRLPMLALLPPPELAPASSLVRMCAWVGEELCTGVEWFADDTGLRRDALQARLVAAADSGEAVVLAGPTAAFAALFESGWRVRLGPGSRLMDTGGAKGMRRPLSRAGFLRACWHHLGLAAYWCVNEYGMSELCSQRYESVLRERFAGASLAPRRLLAPPWLRTRVLDPDTLEEVSPGAPGLLCHHDLANAGSVAVVLTDDLGRAVDDGIAVLGRVPGAPARGCGLLLRELDER